MCIFWFYKSINDSSNTEIKKKLESSQKIYKNIGW